MAISLHSGYCLPTIRLVRGSGDTLPIPPEPQHQGGTFVLLSIADSALMPVTTIDGFVLACLIDPSTGMILASAQAQGEISLPVAAAGAADIGQVLAVLTAKLAANEQLDDVIVTFSNHLHLIRPLKRDHSREALLLVILDRRRANLAMARREIRNFCDSASVTDLTKRRPALCTD